MLGFDTSRQEELHKFPCQIQVCRRGRSMSSLLERPSQYEMVGRSLEEASPFIPNANARSAVSRLPPPGVVSVYTTYDIISKDIILTATHDQQSEEPRIV
eukprot:scaffold5959_cov88-Skeletonema_dohrnii-CCMP3373.AAC.1